MHAVLKWALDHDRHIISLCHGPACLLAGGVGDSADAPLFAGYSVCVFPDAMDDGPNVEIGYVPGHLLWMLGERLTAQGITVLNTDISGQCHQDRKLITGDSPMAGNRLGQMAARALLETVQGQSA
jgi:Putative intracellular protease/amidase